jgi:hypothetical protein
MSLNPNDFTSHRMNARERARVWNELRQIYDEDTARMWINTPHPLLGKAPCECGYDDIMRILDQMACGAFV